MELRGAILLGLKVVAALEPFCEKIDIAGSVRREKAQVGDIDIVLLPKPGRMPDIMKRVEERCIWKKGQATGQNITYNFSNGFQLDLFVARGPGGDLLTSTPSNW